MQISAVIIVKNGAKTIKNTLNSLKSFSDVVVYDNGSTDGTQIIVKEFQNTNLIEGDFIGFGPTKNKAVSYAKNDWILILDSDEVLDEELLSTLKNNKFLSNTVYMLNFNAYYKSKQIKYCGWSGQKIKRIYNKNETKFNDNMVHENIIDDNFNVLVLNGNVKHYSYLTISDFLQKTDRYSEIFAKENKFKKSSSPFKAVYRSFFHFIKSYFFRLGFLDGYAGLLVCYSGSNGVFFKYLKLYEENNK